MNEKQEVNLSEPVPYIKNLSDELDWKLIDQLYGIVSQVSSFCFEIKKFCVTTLFVVIGILIKFTNDNLDHSIFVTSLLITLIFWFLDAVAYYYQVKLRGLMDNIREKIADRSGNAILVTKGTFVIDPDRIKQSPKRLIINAGFNHSM